jgi:murein DD-endopeptidase MepM/ murein hydrolase activator NlpD
MRRIESSGFLASLLVLLATVVSAAVSAGVSSLDTSAGASPTPAFAVVTPPPPLSSPPTPTLAPIIAPTAGTEAPTTIASATDPFPNGATPTTSPLPTPTATPAVGAGQVIGHSVEGRSIIAHRVGEGALKVVLVGDIHGAFEANTYDLVQRLLEHFRTHPDEVPQHVSLWLIPTMNPDGLATDHRWNANGVDLNRNADTDLDGCAGNDWSPDTVGHEGAHPGAGGPFPFSEPETRVVREFLDDAWVAVFYHSAAEAIFVDTCQRHAPTRRLAEALAEGSDYPVPEEGWAGYPVTGDFGDYLAGEGVAAITIELADHEDPEFDRNLAGVRTLLGEVEEILSTEAHSVGAEHVWLDESDTGMWSFAEGSFLHPLALQVVGDNAYLLDGGRVLSLDLNRPVAARLLLSPGDDVEGARVLEPLDLGVNGASLLVLDRAGDVYRFDPESGSWTIERYDRPPGAMYDHYFVALDTSPDTGYLLETTHEQIWRFPIGPGLRQKGSAWLKLPQSRDVDLSAKGSDVYVLTRALNSPRGHLFHYQDGRQISAFQPNVDLMHPRQVLATDGAIYVLDRAGRRLLALEPETGWLVAVHQFPDRRAVSTVWADGTGQRLVLAGRDAVFFPGQPDRRATIESASLLDDPQPHDLDLLEGLRGLLMPIGGASVTSRDFQMPGAPRHYRLGVHEGVDFYGHTTGVPVNRQTPVRAVADGIVIRAMVDYEPLTAAQADDWAAQSRHLGYTPAEVLDGYRGMQVWIDHGGDLVSRYAHLGHIAPGIVEGVSVTQGQTIATVGNSGTPDSVQSEAYDVHLHLELWMSDHYIGQFLRPIEAREWLERILR